MDKDGYIYIAGPMKDRPALNFKAFYRAHNMLETSGWEVFNPAESDVEEIIVEHIFGDGDEPVTLRSILLRDMEALLDPDCVAIYMLTGFAESCGAVAEWSLARAIGLDIYYESNTDEKAYGREGEGGDPFYEKANH